MARVGRADEECGRWSRSAADDVIYDAGTADDFIGDAVLTETVAEHGWSVRMLMMLWANQREDKRRTFGGQ